ncbi:unnamed protein product [Parnassius apollo]|uniref:(apollo) hypothetical protein n=1 Tax=Parnassius apollo TaxID=110799 RepID=A0A8S3Y986_PARAO|nr:unnamed protein product [Parnassius apollo]
MSKRGQYYTWSETSMKLALQALRNREVGLNEASTIYGVPKATLKRRLDGSNQTAKEEKQTPGSAGDLTPELEEKLYQHILEMEACLYGLTPKDPTTKQKVLLLLDGHTSHTKNLDAIKYAKENNVVLLSLPAHTSNKLQPLDTSFFRPLSCYYIDETEKWLRTNPGRRVTVFQISMLFGKAYARAASIATAESGFRSTGIYPFNKDIFQDYEFVTLPEDNDNLPAIENENMIVDPLFSELNDVDDNGIPKDVTSDDPPFSCTSVESTDVNTMQTIPSASKTPVIPSHDLSDNCNNINIQPETPIIATKEVKQWQPLPSTSSEFQICSVSPTAKKVMQELRKGSRKPQSAIELTASPYKRQLEESKAKASKTKSDAEKRKKVAALNLEKTVKSNRGPEKQIKKDVKRKKVPAGELEKWFCKICLHCAIEDMIQCLSCKCWVHEECACVKKGIKKYICPSCTE